jgi:hypothetical protein
VSDWRRLLTRAPPGAHCVINKLEDNKMSREQLVALYLVWRNDFLTVGGFAEHFGLYDSEAELLINLCRQAFENPHPEA